MFEIDLKSFDGNFANSCLDTNYTKFMKICAENILSKAIGEEC